MGIISILFGIFLLAQLLFSLKAFMLMFGVLGFFSGIVMILMAFKNRN